LSATQHDFFSENQVGPIQLECSFDEKVLNQLNRDSIFRLKTLQNRRIYHSQILEEHNFQAEIKLNLDLTGSTQKNDPKQMESGWATVARPV